MQRDDRGSYVEAYIDYNGEDFIGAALSGSELALPELFKYKAANRPASKQLYSRIYNGRTLIKQPSLDQEGFALVRHATAFTMKSDPERLMTGYPDESLDLIRSLSQADLVLPVRGHAVSRRSSAPELGERPTAGYVHADYTPRMLKILGEWLLKTAGIDPQDYGRIAGYQTWRALTSPPQDRPLALCDARSIRPDDIVALGTTTQSPDSKTMQYELTLAKYNPDHRWAYFPNMTLDELLVWRSADTDPGNNKTVFHASFLDPSVAEAAIPRISIDARYLCFYK